MMDKMEPPVESFARHMQMKLDKNRHKADPIMNPCGQERTWKHCHLDWLLFRLRQETLELEEAIMSNDFNGAKDEAADVGNFAMMIHDNLG